MINGATAPHLIPDDAAYSILFRILGDSRTPQGYKRAAAYVKYAMLIDGAECLPPDKYPNAPVATRPETIIGKAQWPTSCPLGMRPVAYRDQVLELARRYADRIVAAEDAAKRNATPELGASAGAFAVARPNERH